MKFLFLPFIILCGLLRLNAQDLPSDTLISIKSDKKLKLGIVPDPPYITKFNNTYGGLGTALWEKISDRIESETEYVEFESIESLEEALTAGRIDFSANPLRVTGKDLSRLEFTQPVVLTNMAIAIPKREKMIFFRLLDLITSWNFVVSALFVLAIILVFGTLAWIFERKHNTEQFGRSRIGIWESFWWSAVTMTTVGYGDKTPKTLGGRIVAIIWMFSAVVIVSSYTATIATSLTLEGIHTKVNSIEDLRGLEVFVLEDLDTQSYLSNKDLKFTPTKDSDIPLRKLANSEIDAFIAEVPRLTYHIENLRLEKKVVLAPTRFLSEYYAIAAKKGSPYLGHVNLALLDIIHSSEWAEIRKSNRFD